MKKILALVLSLVLMLGTATTAFAADEPYQGMGETQVTAYSYGTFYFSIPETVEFTKMVNSECKIQIGEYDIDTTDAICVSIGNLNSDGCITLNHNTKEDVTANLMIYKNHDMTNQYTDSASPLFTISYDELESSYYDEYTFYAQLDPNAKAGYYSGVIQFYFNIMQGAFA